MRSTLCLVLLGALASGCGDDRGADGGVDAGASGSDGGASDAGGLDAGAVDAGDGSSDAGVSDAGASDAGASDAGSDAGPPDPATCPIGPADGCCPLLRYGGTDPDCASLSCSALEASEAIELDDLVGGRRSRDWKGGTGLAWTGRELALARTDWNEAGDARDIVFELRAPDGALIGAPVRTAEGGAPSRAGEVALGYVAATDRFVYANARQFTYDAVGIERDGSIAFTTGTGLSYCNWNSGGWVEMYPTGDRVLAVGNTYTCAGSTNAPKATELLADGSVGMAREYGFGDRSRNCWGASATCDLDCATPRFAYHCSYENQLQLRAFDPTSFVPSPPEVLASGFFAHPRGTAVASDGDRLFVVHTPASLAGRIGELHARTYRPGVGWEGTEYRSSVTEEMMRLIWTGDGYLLAATTWVPAGDSSTPLSRQERFSVRMWHFDRDGGLRESFELDPGMPGLHPYLAWAGDRIAVSWVRPVDLTRWASDEPRRFLRYLGCP